MFQIRSTVLDRNFLATELQSSSTGAYVCFEGWVRDHNDGKQVESLEYQIYEELALKEGQKVLNLAKEKFEIIDAHCFHRHGHLQINDLAIWIGVTAAHREAAFQACKFIIDEIKHRLPVWKKEHYLDGTGHWVFCQHHHHHISFTEEQYYEKQEALIDAAVLTSKHVFIVGAGGLGCPVLVNLVSAGVGKITLVDDDKVSISNLHRQFLYNIDHIGKYKVEVAATFLKKLNPFIKFHTHKSKVENLFFEEINNSNQVDLILDCTDNLASKYHLHDLSFKLRIPFISASVYKMQGQIRSFLMKEYTGCWRCHQSESNSDFEFKSCSETGTLATVTNVVGTIQASEALEYLTTGDNNTSTHTLLLDQKNLTQMKIKNYAQVECKSCKGKLSHIPKDCFEISLSKFDHHQMKLIHVDEIDQVELENKLMKNEQLVLKCERGIKSRSLTTYFRKKGYQSVYFLNSSI